MYDSLSDNHSNYIYMFYQLYTTPLLFKCIIAVIHFVMMHVNISFTRF